MAKPEILLVEDNAGDLRLTLEALRANQDSNVELRIVRDGVQAMDYLKREGTFRDVERPTLIILDLNLPRKDGREVLAEIKRHPDLRRIPVIVLTTSKAEEDIYQSYDFHANCYIAKPVDLYQFFGVIQAIEKFWLHVVELPDRTH